MTSSVTQHVHRSTDPRPARTRAAILAAIQSIDLNEQELTVSAIVAQAGIARSSFYSQFTDIGDVAVQLIREVYENITAVDSYHRATGLGQNAAQDTVSILIEAMGSHRTLYAAVLGANVSNDAHREILRIMADGARPAVQAAQITQIDEDTAVSFLAGGVLAMLTEWLLSPNPLSTGAMQQHILHMLPAWIRTNEQSA